MDIEEEANDRLLQARRNKIQFEIRMREAYFFAAPHRSRNVLSAVVTPDVVPKDDAELNSSFAFELAADFPTVIMNTFLPESEAWAVRKAGASVNPTEAQLVANAIKQGDQAIFEAIASSNFYPACGMGFNPDLAIGTVGLWIDRDRTAEPINCQPIPIRELEIGVGPRGGVDDRFVCRWTRNKHLPELLKGLTIPASLKSEIDRNPTGKTNITWGFWRDWEEDDECWCHVVMVKTKVIHEVTLKGRGSCPLIIARFNPCVEWAWGLGPLIQSIPDLRHLDALAEAKIQNLELGLRPPVAYPDDSFTNIESGIEPGMAYPMRPGSEGAIKNIYTANPPDAAVYDRNDLEQRLRRLFFLDWPHQSGDTPPTATQWLDEMTMAQRRIGTPGLVFWKEFCGETFTRFQYILEKDGMIKPVKIDGKNAVLEPYNPAQRAIEQQDVASFTRFVQIGGAAFPEEFKIASDGTRTLDKLAQKLGVEELWVKRPPADIAAAIKQIAALQQGTAPTAPPAGAATPPPQEMAGATPPPPTTSIREYLGR
jgi:hypothetical protein